jgi:predicted nucleotidyltransferase
MDMLTMIRSRKPEIEALCRRYGVEKLDVFGSAVTGAFREEDSDIDFLVEFMPEARGPGYAERFFGLMESLEDLFGRPVDLVVESAVSNPYFLQSIARSRTLLYAA